MNKRGFLLAEETLKIIIAVMVIIVLIGLLAKIYYGYKNDKELKQAEATLERLSQEIKAMNNGDVKEFEIYNPVKVGWDFNGDYWVISAWPHKNIIPKHCSNYGWENCVCICKNSWVYSILNIAPFVEFVGKTKDKCDEIGTCVESLNKIKIDHISFFEGGNHIGKGLIPLVKKSPITINLEKTNDEIKITRP